MDVATIGGMIGGIVLIITSVVLAGNSLALFLNFPSFVIVVVGSFLSMVAANPIGRVLNLLRIVKVVFSVPTYNKDVLIMQLVGFSESARKEGLLSLDDAMNDVEEDFLRNGMRLVVDGTDPDAIRRILYSNLSQIQDRHRKGIDFFDNWAKVAPAFGLIGTLLGLIGMLANLSDTSSIGPNMAVALITTLYGSFLANMVLVPIKLKLTDRDADELLVKEIMVEGVLSIQSGDNPRILEQRLYAYLSPEERPAQVNAE